MMKRSLKVDIDRVNNLDELTVFKQPFKTPVKSGEDDLTKWIPNFFTSDNRSKILSPFKGQQTDQKKKLTNYFKELKPTHKKTFST
jgi:hypothetical protein